MSLVDVLNQLEEVDCEMEKEAEDFDKLAAEEDAAGRITARGFMDELNKLAQGFKPTVIKQTNPTPGTKGPGGAVPPPRPSSIVSPGAGAGTKKTQKGFGKKVYE